MSTPRTLACKLTTPELQERKRTVITHLKASLKDRRELPDGVSYGFDGSDEMIDLLSAFIKTERLCCDFFEFNLAISANGSARLSLTGPEGTKAFIRDEIGM